MDLSMITDDWAWDESDESSNVRKVVGCGGAMLLQVRLRNGVLQWTVDGRPDGRTPGGCESLLALCRGGLVGTELGPRMIGQLTEELFDHCRRCRALFVYGDYRRALRDVCHALSILDLMRERAGDAELVSDYEEYRASLLANRAQIGMLLFLRCGYPDKALESVNRGVAALKELPTGGVDEEVQMLIAMRRSLRERHNIPLTDEEMLRSLRSEQELAIRDENYEMAARLRDKIDRLREHSARQLA